MPACHIIDQGAVPEQAKCVDSIIIGRASAGSNDEAAD